MNGPKLVLEYSSLPERENIKKNLLEKLKISKVQERILNREREAPVKEVEPSQR